jgi:hypothetical protein
VLLRASTHPVPGVIEGFQQPVPDAEGIHGTEDKRWADLGLGRPWRKISELSSAGVGISASAYRDIYI